MLTVLLTGVVAVLVFGTVVLVHEAGHFLALRYLCAGILYRFRPGGVDAGKKWHPVQRAAFPGWRV